MTNPAFYGGRNLFIFLEIVKKQVPYEQGV